VKALKGVIKDEYEYGRLYPIWLHAYGTHSGVIVVDAAEIVNTCGLVVQHDKQSIRHLVPPREKIWNHELLTTAQIRALTSTHSP
jgi:hypothetical protein